MSRAPLPLGLGATIDVTIAELGGKAFTVHRLTGKMLPALKAVQESPQNAEVAWASVRTFVPGMSEEEAMALSIDSVLKIIALASEPADIVQAMLAKGEGAATSPPTP